jgi:hypothetical protein
MVAVDRIILDEVFKSKYLQVTVNEGDIIYHGLEQPGRVVIEHGYDDIRDAWNENEESNWSIYICKDNIADIKVITPTKTYFLNSILSTSFPVDIVMELGYYPFEAVVDFINDNVKDKDVV